MSRRLESLLGQSGGEPEAPREDHPDGSWRADALGSSRHARLSDHIREPLNERDPGHAERICAEVCRDLLRDFAPVLVWIAPQERRRCQALASWARMSFDFARQTGIEGEKLAALNRIEFTLEQSLAGDPVGQPVYLMMALEDERRPWDRDALDSLAGVVRRRIVEPRPHSRADAEERARSLSQAICRLLSDGGHMDAAAEGWPESSAEAELIELGAALIRLGALLDLGEAMRHEQAALAVEDLPGRGDPRRPLTAERLDRAVRNEAGRVRTSLESLSVSEVQSRQRTACRYLRLAGLALVGRIEALGGAVVEAPPRLSLATRLLLLLRARLPGR